MPLPQTESPGRLLSALGSRGVRLTGPRRVIIGIIETANRHLDAAQILRRAHKLDQGINRVTVYRKLSLLKRHGRLEKHRTEARIFDSSSRRANPIQHCRAISRTEGWPNANARA